MEETHSDFNSQQETNIRSIIFKYVRYWPLFLVSIFVGILTVYLHIRYRAVNEYNIESTILLKNVEAGQGLNNLTEFTNLGLVKNTHSLEDEIGILTSFGVMEEVISKNNYHITFYNEGSIRDVELHGNNIPINITADETAENLIYNTPVHFQYIDPTTYKLSATIKVDDVEKEINSQHTFGEVITTPYGTFTIATKGENPSFDNSQKLYFKIGNKEDVITNYIGRLSVTSANKTGGSLNLSFISNDRKKGEEVLSNIIETYIEKTIKYENELAENTIKMIDDRLTLLSGEIEGVEKTVVDFKTQNTVTNIANNADTYIQQSNDYKNRVAEYQTQINVLEGVEFSLQNSNNETTIGGTAINDPTVNSLITQYNQALIEKQNLSQSASSSNPVIANLDQSLNSLRQSIVQNIKNVKNGYSIASGNLLANANKYDYKIAKVPGMEKKLIDISRDKSTKEGLYLYLLQKREEEVLSLAAPVSSTRIVSYPKSGKWPISPNKKILYFTGLLLGLAIPTSLIYAKEILNNKITSVEDLTKKLRAPFLGEIAKSKKQTIVITEDRDASPEAELFRLLLFNLNYLKKSENNQTILVTSTAKGEGKTFMASNLALTFASNGEKVVVLTFDLREPKLMDNFNLPNSPGISDYIVKESTSTSEIIQKHPNIENFYLVGSGSIKTHVGRLMVNNRIGELMENLKNNFDRIIIDTAPIGLISDAFALDEYIDSTIYVVRKDVTKKDAIKTINTIYDNERLKNTMVVLNDTKAAASYGYGSSKK
ncbi:polysaccharide biosynthesis tyrosine autokinase [Cellulophaga baltica]|uniref:GumC family protein n=1 Tax=Cellulophaga TaxID=104264 RepID=UPI001C06E056|nr:MULTISPECIES: polysaccharide biosynthesis tyrosine autokinase [Cellulophaga]MBU2995639.1 polysaccharide biosynthesis tyrosine autokinase [Cellulophaga baltica]MDO6767033.1 polysaccharide biosynthesis tyrosine autokinase [Cellulophaga sp. 1_MG-2023]